MNTLPKEIILEIASHINREYLSIDIIEMVEYDNIDCSNQRQLIDYYGNDVLYPLVNLYGTCKAFKWLENLEYICVESGRNIRGICNGMTYNIGHDNIMVYSDYKNGSMIKENVIYTDTHYCYRSIDGVEIKISDCKMWYDYNCDCKYCKNIYIQIKEYEKNTVIRNIINSNYDNGKVLIQ